MRTSLVKTLTFLLAETMLLAASAHSQNEKSGSCGSRTSKAARALQIKIGPSRREKADWA